MKLCPRPTSERQEPLGILSTTSRRFVPRQGESGGWRCSAVEQRTLTQHDSQKSSSSSFLSSGDSSWPYVMVRSESKEDRRQKRRRSAGSKFKNIISKCIGQASRRCFSLLLLLSFFLFLFLSFFFFLLNFSYYKLLTSCCRLSSELLHNILSRRNF